MTIARPLQRLISRQWQWQERQYGGEHMVGSRDRVVGVGDRARGEGEGVVECRGEW